MKTFRLFFAMIVCISLLNSCDKESIVTAEQLPEDALRYIRYHQPGREILYVKKERLWFTTKYEVRLDNDVEMEFNSEGMPVDMDIKN